MEKKELQILVKALFPQIKKMIRTETKKVVKSVLKEAVKNQVNEILAERFVGTLSRPAQTLSEVFVDQAPPPPQERQPSRREIAESRRQEILKKLGGDAEFMSDIYDDEVLSMNESMSSQAGTFANPLETDDEGIDPSIFMKRR